MNRGRARGIEERRVEELVEPGVQEGEAGKGAEREQGDRQDRRRSPRRRRCCVASRNAWRSPWRDPIPRRPARVLFHVAIIAESGRAPRPRGTRDSWSGISRHRHDNAGPTPDPTMRFRIGIGRGSLPEPCRPARDPRAAPVRSAEPRAEPASSRSSSWRAAQRPMARRVPLRRRPRLRPSRAAPQPHPTSLLRRCPRPLPVPAGSYLRSSTGGRAGSSRSTR